MSRMTVKINAGAIEIADGNKSQGNIRAQVGRRIVWLRDPMTVTEFGIKVERLSDEEGALGSSIDWPFGSVKTAGANAKVDEVDCEVTRAEKIVVRTADDPGVYKYTITATPVPLGPPITLDPIIIVGR